MIRPDPQRWQRLSAALDAAFRQSSEARREWLERLREDDPALHADVATVLVADAELGGALEDRSVAERQCLLQSLEIRSTEAHGRHPGRTLELQDLVRDLVGEMKADLGSGPADAGHYLPGAVLADRYRIMGLLGRGGFGEVYRADDLKLGQAVALKFVPARFEREPGRRERMLNEVRLARRIAHPSVCRVFDVGEADGRHFLTMEYVDGEDLASLLRRIGRLPPEKAAQIARQVCAGLAAAHEQGILHRDLKPANIMLDGRGRVRIADFGLAVTGEAVHGLQAREGTPAYQAPEQIDGREASVRSDVYALGLVLYEVFTGRKAFPAETLEDLRAQQRQAPPRRPSEFVQGIEPAIERAILECLHEDPAARPASVLAVLAVLPGADPLALAAGETPSPEMVAAAGPRGALTPRIAGALLASVVGLLAIVVALSDRASLLGWIPPVKSADVLEDNARAILHRLGYDSAPRDLSLRAGTGGYYRPYVDTIGALAAAPDRWQAIRHPGEIVSFFEMRQSPEALIPTAGNGQVVGEQDPRMNRGDALIVTDLRGQLRKLVVVPGYWRGRDDSHPTPDWGVLFAAAGLDIASFQAVPSRVNPPVYADERAAWSGTLAEFGGHPVWVHAAADRGRPVYFELYLRWDVMRGDALPTGGNRAVSLPDSWLRPYVFLTLLVLAGVAGALLALRNWRRGRADRQGAARVGVAIAILRMGWWVLGGHHAPDPWGEAFLFMRALGAALLAGAVVWCLYLALEPAARRHPSFVIAWTRLLRGSVRDPLVGRDLLIGVVVGSAIFLVRQQLSVVIPQLAGFAGPPPASYPGPPWIGQPLSLPLLGGRFVVAEFPLAVLSALSAVLTMMAFLLALRLTLRREWLALLVFVVTHALTAPPYHLGGYTAASIVTSVVAGAAWAWLFERVGIVASLAAYFAWHMLVMFPITSRIGSPYFGIGLVGLLAIVALAAYGAHTSIGRPLRVLDSA